MTKKIKTRIALCFSGHMRDFEAKVSNVNHNFRGLEADRFVCTWNRRELEGPQVDKPSVIEAYDPVALHVVDDDVALRHIEKYRRIKVYRSYEAKFWKGRCGDASYNMFYLMRKCNDMKRMREKEYGFKYDLVFRMRPDVELFDLDDLDISEDAISFPKNSYHEGMTDAVFYGSSEAMDKACMCYDLMDMYLFEMKVKWVNEFMLDFHLKKEGLKKVVGGYYFRFADHARNLIRDVKDGCLSPERAARIFSIGGSLPIFVGVHKRTMGDDEAVALLDELDSLARRSLRDKKTIRRGMLP